MRPLILASSFLFLVLGSVVKAEEVYLNCKFQNGTIESTRIGKDNYKKGERGTEDINIIINIAKKNIIEAPAFIDKKFSSLLWTDNEIKWEFAETTNSRRKVNNYILNRRTGVLNEYSSTLIGETDIVIRKFFLCTKESKKF